MEGSLNAFLFAVGGDPRKSVRCPVNGVRRRDRETRENLQFGFDCISSPQFCPFGPILKVYRVYTMIMYTVAEDHMGDTEIAQVSRRSITNLKIHLGNAIIRLNRSVKKLMAVIVCYR